MTELLLESLTTLLLLGILGYLLWGPVGRAF